MRRLRLGLSPVETTGVVVAVFQGTSGHQREPFDAAPGSRLSPGRGVLMATPARSAARSARSTGSVQLCTARLKVPQ